MKLVLASNNKGKIREFRAILSDVEIMTQAEAGADLDVEETGSTFAENAYIKAAAACAATGLPAIADDSGLCVEALNGEPGIHSARYTGSHDDTDEQRNLYLLEKMEGVTDRRAYFESAICCVFPNGDTVTASARWHGTILYAMIGDNGFGYDSVFRPEGLDISSAQMAPEDKNRVSHRAQALVKFRGELKKYLETGKYHA